VFNWQTEIRLTTPVEPEFTLIHTWLMINYLWWSVWRFGKRKAICMYGRWL